MAVTFLAPAKINLTLDITGKREDGYHTVDMVMQTVSLYDDVTVEKSAQEGIRLSCNVPGIPCDSGNTAYKAAALFQKAAQVPGGVCIGIDKHIPTQAGLAGGSSDAAAVLLAMNHLYDAPLSTGTLMQIGAQVGADVPFCLYGGTMLAKGIGTALFPLHPLPPCWIVLVKPDVGVSTKEAYARCDNRGYTENVHSGRLVKALEEGSLSLLSGCLHNDFEEVLRLRLIRQIKDDLCKCGALGACMSGSGPTVFGIFDRKETAMSCTEHLKGTYTAVFLARPVSYGCFQKIE